MFPFTHMSQCERSEETPLHVMPSPLLMSQCERSEETPLHVMPSPLLICHSVRNLKKPHYMSCPWLSNENCASVAMKVLQYSRRYSVINQ